MASLGIISNTARNLLSGNSFCTKKELKVQSVSLLVLFTLWGSTASAFETWSQDSTANTGYCATCHGNFGQLDPGPAYTSKIDGRTWDFTGGSVGKPVSLMDLHASETVIPKPTFSALTCESCHDTFMTAPVTLYSSLNGVTCISCHEGTQLRASHRNSSNFQTEAASLSLSAETQDCAESCHSGNFTQADSDGDGIANIADKCANTPLGEAVNASGCSDSQKVDTDADGVWDYEDACPTQGDAGYGVGSTGCPNTPTDSDNDGVMDNNDSCPNTPTNETANSRGCSSSQTDTDGDGILDKNDECPEDGDDGEGVDDDGCPIPPFSLATLLGGGGSISPYSTLLLLLFALNSLRHRRKD